ncbi:MAG: RagB/SusD family nutrient uptake outer membrane protein, partial [Phaeodactylibacter sp.]|nr:RagB/SusD family nutrient uptake outer membrane protein [Phaeodactylibacter sp.]
MKLRMLIIAGLALALSACQDFLEPDSISTFDTNYVFSNVDDARKGVNAIYVSFGVDGFRSRLSNNMTGNTDIERQSGWTSSGDRYQIWDLNALESNGDLRQMWNAAYEAIRGANIAIDGILESGTLESGDAQTVRTMYHLLGEAYTLRAYWYSMLTYYFGDVPNVREAPKAGNNFFLPKENRNVILSQVIQDMIDIEENMLWAEELPYGIEQVNREYTLGLIARIALQRGGYYLTPDLNMVRDGDYLEYYQIARDYTEKLMMLKDRPLPDDYRQVFMNQCKFVSPVNEEILFEVPFAIGNGDVGWNIGIDVEGGPTASHDYGSGNNYMAIPPSYYFSFDTLDIRRDVTCAFYKVNTDFVQEFCDGGISNIAQGKWSRHFLDNPPGASSAKGTGINWPMLRYADVLLMFAEAENELNGPTGPAQEALKRVRQRAFAPQHWAEKADAYVASVSAGKQSFFEAIVDERAWEFGGEMIRKYELIRWNIYSEKMAETVETLKAMADAAFTGSGQYSGLPDYIYWKRDGSGQFTLLNPNRKVAAPPDETWNRQPFLLDLHDEVYTYRQWITRDWENYINGLKPGVVRYIFPIPAEAITNSQGTLANDGYMFGG